MSTSVVAASGASYTRMPVDAKATIDEVTQREQAATAAAAQGASDVQRFTASGGRGQLIRLTLLSHAFVVVLQVASSFNAPAGVSFYEVGSKLESISATKALVLYDGPARVWLDGSSAREKMQMDNGKAAGMTAATVESRAGAGSKLWVQSTSSNRALAAGTTLIRAGAAGTGSASSSKSAAAAKPAAKPKAAAAAKGKRKAKAECEEEEDEEEEEEAPAKPARGKKAKVEAAAPVKSSSSGSSSGVKQMSSSSGAQYAFIPISDKQTIGDAASAADIACDSGCGFYEVGSKKEDVSAQKQLVLVIDNAIPEDDIASIRKTLGMGAGKASINATMVRAKAGDEARLFVQSSSPNRGLLPDSTLCVKTTSGSGGAGSGAVKKAPAKKVAAKKKGSKKAAGEDEGEEEEEDAEMNGEEGDGDEDEEEDGFAVDIATHVRKSTAGASVALKAFLSEASWAEWTTADGKRSYIIAGSAPEGYDDLCVKGFKWPRAWVGGESEPVINAIWRRSSTTSSSASATTASPRNTHLTAFADSLVAIHTFSSGDETGVFILSGDADALKDVEECCEQIQEGLASTLGLDDECLSYSSGIDETPKFTCPALENPVWQAERSTAAAAAGVGAGVAAKAGPKKKATAASRVGVASSTTTDDVDMEDSDVKKTTTKEQAASSSSSDVKHASSSSGTPYAFIPIRRKQTIGDAASAVDIACDSGCGFYEVGSKKEDVSAQKRLVLVIDACPEDDVASIRKKLGMGAGKASINAAMVRAKAGDDARLFVQSSSPNRGLLPDSTLCVKTASGGAGSGAAKKAPAAKKAAAKKKGSKKAAEEEEDEEEDDDGEEVEDGCEITLKSHKRLAAESASVALAAFLTDTTWVEWISKSGQSYIVAEHGGDSGGDLDELEWAWPRAFINEESQPILAAIWTRKSLAASPKGLAPLPRGAHLAQLVSSLVALHTFSPGGDETSVFYTPAATKDINEFCIFVEKSGNAVSLGLSDDCFRCSSGDEAVEDFVCPALADKIVHEYQTYLAITSSSSPLAGVAPVPAVVPAPAAGAAAGPPLPKGVVRVRATSGKSYLFVPVTVKQQIDEVCSGAGVPCNIAFYEVWTRKEDVSAGKMLVLLSDSPAAMSAAGTKANDDIDSIRKELGMGKGKATVKGDGVRAKGGFNARLFVQSTSGNRGLLPGTMLCVLEDDSNYASSGGGGSVGAVDGAAAAAGGGSGPVSLSSIFAAHYSGGAAAAASAASSAPAPVAGDKDDADNEENAEDGVDDDEGGEGGADALSPYLLALPALRWSATLTLEDPELFPAGSPWALKYAERNALVDESPSKKLQKPVKDMLRRIKALGFAKASSPSASTPPTEGWFRDTRLERRILAQLRAHPNAPSDKEPLSVTAHVHSSAPHSIAVVLLELGGDEGGEFFFVTEGPELLLLGCAGAHPLMLCNEFEYQNSDGSGPTLVVRQADIDAGYAEAGAVALDKDNVEQMLATVTKFFGEFCNDQYH